jgi:hypothetical protein
MQRVPGPLPTEGPHEYARRLLVAVESEFGNRTPDWLDDLSKLVVVDVPMRIFIAARAGSGLRPDLEEAQLQTFAEVLRDSRYAGFILALLPQPSTWEMGMPESAVSTFVLQDGDWIRY